MCALFFLISSPCLDISPYLKNIYLKLSVIKGWETTELDMIIFFFFWGNWSVRIILVYANFTRWNQSKHYILKLHRRRLKWTYIWSHLAAVRIQRYWYISFLIQMNWFLLDHFIHTCTHTHSLTSTRLCTELIKKELWLNNPLLSDNGISYRGANMQKAIWKCILVVVRFYYAGRCHVCYEAECRWQSGRNGSLILTMINEQRWKMNYIGLSEARNIFEKILTHLLCCSL